jgi:hypothetical protein
VKPASSEARALAGAVADLFSAATAALLVFMAVDRWAPPQDLTWKPLHIDEPIGLATTTKLRHVVADRERCLAFLAEQDVDFTPTPDRTGEGFCTVEAAGLVGPQGLRLEPRGPTMTCGLTAALAIWTRQSVAPASQSLLGSEAVVLEHYGSYACRRIYGRQEGRVSQHAHAAAFDVAAFRLADGRRLSIAADWERTGPEGAFLRRIRDDACRLFGAVLTPDYNAAHRDHLHLDAGPYSLCR